MAAVKNMFITVNGEDVAYEEGITVQRVLELKNYIYRMIFVKVNGQLIAKKDYGTTFIPPGAKVEIIHQISGG